MTTPSNTASAAFPERPIRHTFPDGSRFRCGAGNTDWCVELDWPDGMFPYSPAPSAYAHWHGTLLTEKRDASGLLYRRNRYYDPVTARFTQEDPIGLAGSINIYGFAAGYPVSYSDPYGLAACPFAPEDSPRYSGSFLDCTAEEMRRAQGVEEPILLDPLVVVGVARGGASLVRHGWLGLRSFVGGFFPVASWWRTART